MINCQLVGSHFATIAVNNGVSKHASVCGKVYESSTPWGFCESANKKHIHNYANLSGSGKGVKSTQEIWQCDRKCFIINSKFKSYFKSQLNGLWQMKSRVINIKSRRAKANKKLINYSNTYVEK